MANIELDGANRTIKVDSSNLTLDIPGDIILDADGANVTFKDGGTSVLDISNSSTDAVLTVSTQDKDLIIKGDDGGSAITAATFDMSDAGTLILNHDLVVADDGKVGSASATDAMTISSGGIVTFKDDILIKDAGTIGSASDADAIAIAANGVVTFTQAPVFPDGSLNIADIDLDGGTDIGAAIVDADLFLIDDGAGGTMRKTAASRIKTYVGGGISEIDTWVYDDNESISAGNGTLSSNWSREDDGGFDKLGTGMSESSGIFSFPSTGFWRVDGHIYFECGGARDRMGVQLHVTTDNSSYDLRTENSNSCSSNGNKISAGTSAIIDVTNTTNVKVKMVYHASDSATLVGSSTVANTFMQFLRLGDT